MARSPSTAGPACAGCHQLINPLGFLFENYGGIGEWRTMDGEYPIDAAAEVPGIDVAGAYANATELMPRLAESEDMAAGVTGAGRRQPRAETA